jgi:hypothetical protein
LAEYTRVNNKWVVTVQENGKTKELFIQFPEDAINQVGWHDGDILEWINNGDGSWCIRKKEVNE